MFKVALIDDEPVIREGLKTIINWSALNMVLCGEAEDGRSGLALIREKKPDLAVIDIKMPEMNGLELIRHLKKEGIPTRIILLTAYSDFKFAQEAVELGIDFYILKPIEEEELEEKVGRIKALLEEQTDAQNARELSVALSRDKALQSLVLGRLDEETLQRCNRIYGLGLPWASYQIVLIDKDPEDESDEEVDREMLCYGAESFVSSQGHGYVLVMGNDVVILYKNMGFASYHRILVELRKEVERRSGIKIILSLGSVVQHTGEIPSSYKLAKRLMEKKFIYGNNKIIALGVEETPESQGLSDRMEEGEDPLEPDLLLLSENLYNAVDVNNVQLINDLLEELRRLFLNGNQNEASIKATCAHLYMKLINGLADSAELKEKAREKEAINEMYRKSSLQGLHGYLKFLVLTLSEELSAGRPDNPVKKLTDYIARNYARDLKLEELAVLFNYNSAYLGKLFRNTTGMPFNTYLDHIRISKAKEFLKDGLKVYQVAERIGFKDIDYFYKKFKKYTGVSPSGYKTPPSGTVENGAGE